MSKHTPGPWTVEVMENGYGYSIVARNKQNKILRVIGPVAANGAGIKGCSSKAKADARLIAASPELLEALKAVVSVTDRATHEFDLARAAIAKAEGK